MKIKQLCYNLLSPVFNWLTSPIVVTDPQPARGGRECVRGRRQNAVCSQVLKSKHQTASEIAKKAGCTSGQAAACLSYLAAGGRIERKLCDRGGRAEYGYRWGDKAAPLPVGGGKDRKDPRTYRSATWLVIVLPLMTDTTWAVPEDISRASGGVVSALQVQDLLQNVFTRTSALERRPHKTASSGAIKYAYRLASKPNGERG